MKSVALSFAAVAAVSLACTSDAAAQGFGRGGFGYGWGQSNIFDLYRTGRLPTPPYFALNPPVYYSYPVPRTYGYSPFYYPGTVRTPDIIPTTQPLEILNPYVPSSATKPAPPEENTVRATPQPTRVEPLIVENPFVRDSAGVYNVSH